MSQEEHDQIAQYLTICEWQIVVDQKFWTKYFWGKKYIFLSNWRGQAERLVDRRHWPSSWGLLSPWFWLKTSSLDNCVQKYFCQHSRALGCGCLGHRGLLKIGARVGENFSCWSQNVTQKKFFYAAHALKSADVTIIVNVCRWAQPEWKRGLCCVGPSKWGLRGWWHF